MADFRWEGTTPDDVRYEGTTVNELRYNGTVIWAPGDIPPGVSSHWRVSAGSGSTLTDHEGTRDASLNHTNWRYSDGSLDGWYLAHNGSGDGASISNSDNHFSSLNDFTVFTVLNVDSYPSSSSMEVISCWNYSTNEMCWRLYWYNGGWWMNVSRDGSNWWGAGAAGGQESGWFSLAVTRSGSTITFYINGSAIYSETNWSDTLYSNGLDVLIGGTHNGGYNFNGKMDNIAFAHSALTQSEIQTLHDLTPRFQSGYSGVTPLETWEDGTPDQAWENQDFTIVTTQAYEGTHAAESPPSSGNMRSYDYENSGNNLTQYQRIGDRVRSFYYHDTASANVDGNVRAQWAYGGDWGNNYVIRWDIQNENLRLWKNGFGSIVGEAFSIPYPGGEWWAIESEWGTDASDTSSPTHTVRLLNYSDPANPVEEASIVVDDAGIDDTSCGQYWSLWNSDSVGTMYGDYAVFY